MCFIKQMLPKSLELILWGTINDHGRALGHESEQPTKQAVATAKSLNDHTYDSLRKMLDIVLKLTLI